MERHHSKRTSTVLLICILAIALVLGVAAGLLAYKAVGAGKNPPKKTIARAPTKTVPIAPPPPLAFDVNQAMAHVNQLAGTIGLREEGTEAEEAAAGYISERLASYGYSPTTQAVPITTNGRTTHNVIATLEGTSEAGRTIVIGAHMDSKGGPGANDNATGCGILLELARVLKHNNKQVPSIEFVFFGGEEIAIGAGSNDHHWGSRYFVKALRPEEIAGIAGMISVDMVGAGPEFRDRSMNLAPGTMRDMLLQLGSPRGLTLMADTSSTGMSDHEPFEKANIPAAWLEYRDFSFYHTPGDTVSTVDVAHVQNTGQLVQDFIESYLTVERVNQLTQRN